MLWTARLPLTLALLALCLSWSGRAHAWLDLTVTGDTATVEVQRDGRATVTHDVLLRVRGGPLRHFSLTGVDQDAAPLGDATLTRARSGAAAGPPILLTTDYDGERAHFELTLKKGVRGGNYLLQFSYRTDLRKSGKLLASPDGAHLRWAGLLLDQGVDSMQTTFVLPRGARSPRLPGADEAQTAGMVATDDGVFLSELMQAGSSDALQLTRPHVARGERVVWQVVADAGCFTGLPSASAAVAANPAASASAPKVAVEPPAATNYRVWVAAVLIALLLSLFVFLKHRQGGTSFLLPMRSGLRLLGIFVSMVASLACALLLESATLAGVGLIAAMLLMLQRPVREPIAPKGPGRWQAIDLETVELVREGASRSIRWLDAGSSAGLVLFVLSAVAFAIVGLRLMGQSPYHSAMALVYSTALVPLFFTLGAPGKRSLLEEQCEFLTRLSKRLARKSFETHALGRFSLDAERPDDLRLQLVLPHAVPGLISFEVGLGFVDTTLRRLLVPAVVVRVREDSDAHAALPRHAHWSRGRTPEERVAVIRSPLPLISSSVETIQQTALALQKVARAVGAKRRPRQTASRQSTRSEGSSVVTSKRATGVLPGHATR